MSTLKVNTLIPRTGTTISMGSGATIHNPGSVLQVKEGNLLTGSQFSTTSASLADVGLSVQITPKFSSSKILVMFQGFGGANGSSTALLLQIQRQIGSGSFSMITGGGFFYQSNQYESCGLNKLDSPNTTSQLTYKLQGQLSQASGTGYLPGGWGGDYNTAGYVTLIAMEIAQ